ncbi:hypothetical protein [Streptomyces sp. SP18CS02]|uniref:hypothetical protein n=1 Tax=Streptomyces sp. SP18CS02 TaxID=3002531 RepID=UPI002E786C79|nr:hypothetical protein [Streptomyces sp. SP18CS02]MEE1755715.1 hypothetical protein [Streptomyces sp. SP18CS02]
MTWWLKVRRVHRILPWTLVAFLAFTLLVRDGVVLMPSLLGGGSAVALTSFAPIPLTVGLMEMLSARLDGPETSGVRGVRALDALLTVAVTLFAVLCGLVLAWPADHPDAAAIGRNSAFLVGLMLCLRAFAGRRAVMAPVAWLMLAILLGAGRGGRPYAWTVVREPADAWPAALASVLVFLAGAATLFRPPRSLT